MKRDINKGFYNVRVIDKELPKEFQTKHGKTVTTLSMDDIEKFFPEAIYYDKDGNKEDWYIDVVVSAMLAMLQDLKAEVDELTKEINSLKER